MSAYVRVNPLDENVAPGERETIRAWAKQIFCNIPLARQFEWTKEGAYRIVVYSGESLVSFLKILERTCLVDEQQVRIGGVAGVMTPPEHRGRGYAGLALREARRVIFEKLKAQLGLLLCEPELVKFYTRHGWQSVDCPVKFEQSSGNAVWPYCTMILAKPGKEWKPNSIDLCGFPW